MQGIEQGYCTECICAVLDAWRGLYESSAARALRLTKYGKEDTLGLDAMPEIAIHERLRRFDRHAILVTEELDASAKRRWPTDPDPVLQPLMFFCDPTDRSKFLKLFIEEISKGHEIETVGKLMTEGDAVSKWEKMFEPPASITGATTSITCVRKGAIVFSVILNYITQTLFVAVPEGVFHLKLPRHDDITKIGRISLPYVLAHGKRLAFPSKSRMFPTVGDSKRFVTFLGKKGYEENFNDCMIFLNPGEKDAFLHHNEPGGPARILYLSELQKGHPPIGFIMANGEKVGEWIHWFAFALFANKEPALKIFEVVTDRPWIKDGVPMSTVGSNSLFTPIGDAAYLDVSKLRTYSRPSKFRSMIVVTPANNDRIIQIMWQHNYREITLVRDDLDDI